MPINLLPQDLKPKGYTLALAKSLKKLALIFLLLFLVGSASLFALLFFYSRQVEENLARQESLRNQVKALEATEQKLILLKDRIDKFSAITTTQNQNLGVGILEDVSQHFSQGISFKGAKLSEQGTIVSVYSDNLTNLASFIRTLSESEKFRSIYLVGFSFREDEGYSAEFRFVK